MATEAIAGGPPVPGRLKLTLLARYPRMRPLLWEGSVLYAARGYTLLEASMEARHISWKPVGRYRPDRWRRLSSSWRLASRLFRDGFHALARLSSGALVGAVPGAIVSLAAGESEFRITHKMARGTRPLHFAVTPDGHLYWGEYFDNPGRDAVYIYGSEDGGATWRIAHAFPAGDIRHVHNIVYDRWENCLWVLTGDRDSECGILRASCDFSSVRAVVRAGQQARSVALVPRKEGLYFSTDTPLESNHVYLMDRAGALRRLSDLASSSICGCSAGDAIFFSTMVEPSPVNPSRTVSVYGARLNEGLADAAWRPLLLWTKDRWPASLLQYGNAFLPDGENTTGLLAVSPVAVQAEDGEMSLWRLES